MMKIDKVPFPLVFGLIIVLNIFIYFPSIYHIPRVDQVWYLAEYAGRDNSWQSFIDSIYYNRTRTFFPGDVLLFRPLLFFILSIERICFGYNFILWQVAGILAHIFVIYAMARLLHKWSAADSVRSTNTNLLLILAFFSFLFVNLEAVIWHHITAYLIFAGLILLALEQVEAFIDSQGRGIRELLLSVLLLLAAVLIYETGAIYIFLIFLYVFNSLSAKKCQKLSFFLLVPILIFLTWNISHWCLTNVQADPQSAEIVTQYPVLRTVTNIIVVAKLFILGGFLIQPHDVIFDWRLILKNEFFHPFWPLNDWVSTRWVGLLLMFAFFAASFRLKLNQRDLARLRLLLLMIAAYLFVIAVGRSNVRMDYGLRNTVYYFYNFWVIFSLILFIILRNAQTLGVRRIWLRKLLFLAVSLFLICNAWSVYKYNLMMSRHYKPARTYLANLDKYVNQHKEEPDFSFTVYQDNPVNGWCVQGRQKDPPGTCYSIPQALYPRFFNASHAKWIFEG